MSIKNTLKLTLQVFLSFFVFGFIFTGIQIVLIFSSAYSITNLLSIIFTLSLLPIFIVSAFVFLELPPAKTPVHTIMMYVLFLEKIALLIINRTKILVLTIIPIKIPHVFIRIIVLVYVVYYYYTIPFIKIPSTILFYVNIADIPMLHEIAWVLTGSHLALLWFAIIPLIFTQIVHILNSMAKFPLFSRLSLIYNYISRLKSLSFTYRLERQYRTKRYLSAYSTIILLRIGYVLIRPEHVLSVDVATTWLSILMFIIIEWSLIYGVTDKNNSSSAKIYDQSFISIGSFMMLGINSLKNFLLWGLSFVFFFLGYITWVSYGLEWMFLVILLLVLVFLVFNVKIDTANNYAFGESLILLFLAPLILSTIAFLGNTWSLVIVVFGVITLWLFRNNVTIISQGKEVTIYNNIKNIKSENMCRRLDIINAVITAPYLLLSMLGMAFLNVPENLSFESSTMLSLPVLEGFTVSIYHLHFLFAFLAFISSEIQKRLVFNQVNPTHFAFSNVNKQYAQVIVEWIALVNIFASRSPLLGYLRTMVVFNYILMIISISGLLYGTEGRWFTGVINFLASIFFCVTNHILLSRIQISGDQVVINHGLVRFFIAACFGTIFFTYLNNLFFEYSLVLELLFSSLLAYFIFGFRLKKTTLSVG